MKAMKSEQWVREQLAIAQKQYSVQAVQVLLPEHFKEHTPHWIDEPNKD